MAVLDLPAAIRARTPVTLSRWGDNELEVMVGENQRAYVTRDATCYYFELQAALYAVLAARPKYPLALTATDPRAAAVIAAYGADTLNWRPVEMSAVPLAEAVGGVPAVLVGPPSLARLKKGLRFLRHVTVPPLNAFLCRDQIVRAVMDALEDVRDGPAAVMVAAGVTAPLVVDDLHRLVGGRHSLVDVGGLWNNLEFEV